MGLSGYGLFNWFDVQPAALFLAAMFIPGRWQVTMSIGTSADTTNVWRQRFPPVIEMIPTLLQYG